MIVKTKILAYQYITSKKTGQEFLKVWVKVPCTKDCTGECIGTCVGEPVESGITSIPPGMKVNIGTECVVSVDRFGRIRDIQL